MTPTRRLRAAGTLLTALALLACGDSEPTSTGTVGTAGSPSAGAGGAGANAGTGSGGTTAGVSSGGTTAGVGPGGSTNAGTGGVGGTGAGGQVNGGMALTPPCWSGSMGLPGFWDTQFTVAGIDGNDVPPVVRDIAPDGQGGLLIAGSFYAVGKWPSPGLASWKDGQLSDAGLPPGSPAAPADGFDAVAVSAKGVKAYATTPGASPAQGAIWIQQGEKITEVGLQQGRVRRLTWVGDTLWVAGSFALDGGPKNLATWDGTSWHGAAGGDPDGPVLDVMADTDGAVLIGGQFSSVGKVASPAVARWNGTSWSSKLAMSDPSALVLTLARDKAGRLHAGGRLGFDGDSDEIHLRRHDGTAWVAIGRVTSTPPGFSIPALPPTGVSQILADGDGLIVSGSFDHVQSIQGAASDVAAAGTARWDGTSWQSLDDGSKPVGSQWYSYGCNPLGIDVSCVWSLPQQRLVRHGDAVLVGGSFGGLGGVASANLTSYRDGAWKAVGETGSGFSGSLAQVRGVGPTTEVYGLVRATHASGLPLGSPVVRFEESATDTTPGHWVEVGPALPAEVSYCSRFAVDPTSKVPWLVCDGTKSGTYGRLYRLTSGAWQMVAPSLTEVRDLDFAPDGSLHVVGGGKNFVARLDGGQPTMLGTFDDQVTVLTFAPRAGGYDVVVGGYFTSVGGAPANHVARWDGATWSALGQGSNAPVLALAATPDFVYLASVAQTMTDRLVLGRWDGSAWTELGDEAHGLPKPTDPYDLPSFQSIQPLGDGVVVAGRVRTATGASDVLVFQGGQFSPLDRGSLDNSINSVAVTCSGLWFGGTIHTVGDRYSAPLVPAIGVARRFWDPVLL